MNADTVRDEISEPFERLCQEVCTPDVIRAIEREDDGTARAMLWHKLNESGFVDALVPEANGGSGLILANVHGILESCGRHAVPLPIGETMIARAILVAARETIPPGPIMLGCAVEEGGELICRLTPYARTGEFALLTIDETQLLLSCADAQRTLFAENACAGELRWPDSVLNSARKFPAMASLLHAQASILAAHISGALSRVFSMTLGYANERTQFGKPIGKFQAVQHQIAVLAEHNAMASMASRIGCDSNSHLPQARRAAMAKSVTSEAAASVASLGHALHGAIGMTEEYDLQLFTRRLHEWRLCAGTESYWNHELGAALVDEGERSMLDFVRESVR